MNGGTITLELKLPLALSELLEREARRQGLSASHLVAKAVRNDLVTHRRKSVRKRARKRR